MAKQSSTISASGTQKTYTFTDQVGGVLTITANLGAPTGTTFSFSGGPVGKDAMQLLAQFARQAATNILPL